MIHATATRTSPRSRARRPRAGIIFVTAMWVIIVLVAVVLVFARSMKTETVAASNRLATQQASTIELGAEQYVASAVDACQGDALTVLTTPCEQLKLQLNKEGGLFFKIVI